ncbi:MAG: type II toxin-antitoxin system VapC family toxin [Deinococcota bacterium]
MKECLIDTDILSYYLKNNQQVIQHVTTYLEIIGKLNISIVTYHEVLSGLKFRDAYKRLQAFNVLVASNNIIPLTKEAVDISSMLYASLRQAGTPIDDMDLLIAGTAREHNWALATHNQRHFGKIEGLELQDWTQP